MYIQYIQEVSSVTTQMVIRIESELKEKLTRIARMEGKTSSQMIRELIETYINERDIEVYIDKLWDKVGKKLKAKGTTLKDVDRAIAETRRKK